MFYFIVYIQKTTLQLRERGQGEKVLSKRLNYAKTLEKIRINHNLQWGTSVQIYMSIFETLM